MKLIKVRVAKELLLQALGMPPDVKIRVAHVPPSSYVDGNACEVELVVEHDCLPDLSDAEEIPDYHPLMRRDPDGSVTSIGLIPDNLFLPMSGMSLNEVRAAYELPPLPSKVGEADRPTIIPSEEEGE